jgi:hypothetical protein
MGLFTQLIVDSGIQPVDIVHLFDLNILDIKGRYIRQWQHQQ